MEGIRLLLIAAICSFVGTAYGTKCSTGPGHRLPITCPGLLDPTKNHCCEISGSYRCCDEEEFARQKGNNDIEKPHEFRQKRGLFDNLGDVINDLPDFRKILPDVRQYLPGYSGRPKQPPPSEGLSAGAIVGIVIGSIVLFFIFCACCYFCYFTFHIRNAQTQSPTIIQLVDRNPGVNRMYNSYATMSNQPDMQQSFTSVQLKKVPPPYNRIYQHQGLQVQ